MHADNKKYNLKGCEINITLNTHWLGWVRLVGAWVDVLEVEVGQHVRLQCEAEGEPQPEVGCCVFFVLQLSLVTQGGLGQRRIRPSGGRSRCDC